MTDGSGEGSGGGCTRLAGTRAGGWLAVAALVAAGCSAEPERREPVGEVVRPSYSVRLDSETAAPEEYHLVEDDDGIRVETGPAGIAYRDEDVISSGDFSVETTFLQYGAPLGYREAYGIFVGGLDLQGPDQEYTYLLVRPTGDYLIKRRIGEVTETFVDWTPHDAVGRVIEEGDEPRNVLAITVTGLDTSFTVNGVTVHTMPTGRVRPYGIAGVRVNHRLDVRVDGWAVAAARDDT